jgi:hypothetical protein
MLANIGITSLNTCAILRWIQLFLNIEKIWILKEKISGIVIKAKKNI